MEETLKKIWEDLELRYHDDWDYSGCKGWGLFEILVYKDNEHFLYKCCSCCGKLKE